MPGDARYTAEKYWTAVDILATGTGSLADRLIDAYVSSAMRATPPKPGAGPPMPDDTVDRLIAIDTAMTAKGSIEDTVRAMTIEEQRAVVEQILELTHELLELKFDPI